MVQRHIETEIEIEAPAACVWGLLTDFNHMPSWNPFITGISGNLAQGETLSLRIAPPGKPAMRFNPVVLALVKGLLDGEHYFLLEPLNEKRTRLRHGEIFSGLFVGMLSGMLLATQQGFEAMNSALKAQAEMRQKS